MRRFQRILLALKEPASPLAAKLERAAKLAKDNGAELEIVHVMEDSPSMLRAVVKRLADFDRLLEAEQRECIEKIVADFRAQGISARGKVLHGRPFVAIVREVLAEGHDLVIVGAHSEAPDGKRFGARALRLLRSCPCPVWALKPKAPESFHRIVAAIDPNPNDPVRHALNVKVLELASSLSASEPADLFVVHAWQVYGESLWRSRLEPSELAALTEHTEARARKGLEVSLEEAGVAADRVQTILRKGDAGAVIARVVSEQDAELVVMGTVARTGIPGLLIGNTAEKVLSQIDCSILALKPEGFVSPVTLE